MKIRYASDLHLEFRIVKLGSLQAALDDVLPAHEDDSDSHLILAGDVASKPDQLIKALEHICPRFKEVIYVPGNHEYYGSDMHVWNANFVELASNYSSFKNLHYAAGDVGEEVIDGIRYIYTTLWAHGGDSLMDRGRVGSALNDFRLIRNGYRTFSVPAMCELNKKMSQGIWDKVVVPFDGKTVVVTHHIPLEALCHARFGTELNGGFASREDAHFYGFTDGPVPDYWFFGHTHDTIDRHIGTTRFLCNPAGYPGEHRDDEFNQYGVKFLEI